MKSFYLIIPALLMAACSPKSKIEKKNFIHDNATPVVAEAPKTPAPELPFDLEALAQQEDKTLPQEIKDYQNQLVADSFALLVHDQTTVNLVVDKILDIGILSYLENDAKSYQKASFALVKSNIIQIKLSKKLLLDKVEEQITKDQYKLTVLESALKIELALLEQLEDHIANELAPTHINRARTFLKMDTPLENLAQSIIHIEEESQISWLQLKIKKRDQAYAKMAAEKSGAASEDTDAQSKKEAKDSLPELKEKLKAL